MNALIKAILNNKRVRHASDELQTSVSFYNVMKAADYALDINQDINDKIIALEYLLKAIAVDFTSDIQSRLIYKDYNKEQIQTHIPFFPSTFYDNDMIEHSFIKECNTDKQILVDLNHDNVLTTPWNMTRFFTSGINIYRNPFVFHQSNHLSYYYSDINICWVHNGLHSTSAGVYHKKGKILSKYCDISPLFNHIKTDGLDWYCVHSGYKLDKLFDFRIGALFEIAKIKHNLLIENRP